MAAGMSLREQAEHRNADVRPQSGSWLDSWATGVRRAATPVLLINLPETRIIAMSVAACRLLALPDDGTLSLSDVTGSAKGTLPLHLMAQGMVETLQGRTTLCPSRAVIGDLWWSARSVRAPGGGDLAIMTLDPVGTAHTSGRATPIAPRVLGDEPVPGEAIAVVTTDDRWRVTAVRTNQSNQSSYAGTPLVPIGASALELVCHESRADLLRTMALATTGARAGMRLRIRLWGDSQPHAVSAAVSMRHDDAGTRFVLELHSVDEASSVARAAELEGRLRRIAAEIQDVELMESTGRRLHVVSDSRLRGLSARQLEIVSRLRQGERVPAIARSMFIAPSTVRNHLTAVFRRFDVNSQAELIEALRATSG